MLMCDCVTKYMYYMDYMEKVQQVAVFPQTHIHSALWTHCTVQLLLLLLVLDHLMYKWWLIL